MIKIIFSVLLILSPPLWAGTVSIDGGYVRLMPPMQPNSGAFMKLTNSSGTDVALISAASDVAETIELHTHIHDNGVMRMRQVKQIDVPANGETELKPGGFHVMLIGLKAPLALNQMINFTFTFDDGSTEQLMLPVKSVMAGMGMKGGMKMDKKGMKMDHSKMGHDKKDMKMTN